MIKSARYPKIAIGAIKNHWLKLTVIKYKARTEMKTKKGNALMKIAKKLVAI